MRAEGWGSMKRVQKNLEELAIEYVLSELRSNARTAAGKERAIQNWKARHGIVNICDYYISALMSVAQDEMRMDFQHRDTVAKETVSIKEHPIWVRSIIAETEEVQKKYKSKMGKYVECWKDDRCKEIAHSDVMSYTRKRKVWNGYNGKYAGLHTNTNGKTGWDCVSDHYCNYTAIVDQAGHYIAFRSHAVGEFEIFKTCGKKMKARGKVYSQQLVIAERGEEKPHILRRFFSLSIPRNSGITWEWDRQEKKGYYLHGVEKYHTISMIGNRKSREYLHEAVEAFQKRRNEKIAKDKEDAIFAHLDSVFVSREDSIKAGNCVRDTEEFENGLMAEIGAEGECAIRADLVWAKRQDNYTKRAILFAALNH